MKKSLFLIPAFALAFASCSEKDPGMIPNGGEGIDDSGFLYVNIVNPSSGTRADDDFALSEADQESGGYEAGYGFENFVQSVRFYFFDAAGNAKKVSGDDSFIDKAGDDIKQDATAASDSDINVEKVVAAMLVLDSRNGNDLSALQMLAVINPTKDLTDIGNLSMSDLNKIVDNYDWTTSTPDNFLMSNAVYRDANSKQFIANPITQLYSDEDNALANPVNIYVERVLAKVRFGLNLTVAADANGNYAATRKVETAASEGQEATVSSQPITTVDGEQIYVDFLGWNLTTLSNKSYLLKHFDSNWMNANPWSGWNNYPHHRSFWALNPIGIDYKFFAFNSGDNAANKYQINPVNADEIYIQENATDNASGNLEVIDRTKVIIAAQLKDANGDPITLGEIGGLRYKLTSKDNDQNFIGAVLRYLPVVYYKQNGTTYTEISPADVEFVRSWEKEGYDDASTDNLKEIDFGYRCYMYLQLSGNDSWFTKNAEGAYVAATADDINEALGLINVKIWNNGYTYFYFDIEHLNQNPTSDAEAGQWGIVRNHIYDTEVTGFYGLGTPVYDPDEKIVPEKPDTDDSMLAARINVLAWKVVSQKHVLEW